MAASPAAAVKPRGVSKKYDAHSVAGPTDRAEIADAAIKSLKLSDKQLLRTYQLFLEVRRFEEQSYSSYRAGKIGGYLHLYIGQEAVSLGIVEACKPGDQYLSSYRDHAHCLNLGSDPNAVMAELYGKGTGISRGKGGSMHLFDKEHGFAGGYGIVGGNLPLAVGIGWALKYGPQRDGNNICVCFLGDGSMNSGAFHESLNMAQLYELPILFLLENNKYAMGTSVERSSANTDLSSRADSYAMANSKVDGMDYFAVRTACQEIVDKMRKKPAPYFLEAVTYRYVGHGAADNKGTQSTYREDAELEEWKRHDPVLMFEQTLRRRKVLTDKLQQSMDDEAKKIAHDAAEFAEQSPLCSPEELTEDVYVD
jgi:pyruvate dehydrogenase E1 component alpha subunit